MPRLPRTLISFTILVAFVYGYSQLVYWMLLHASSIEAYQIAFFAPAIGVAFGFGLGVGAIFWILSAR